MKVAINKEAPEWSMEAVDRTGDITNVSSSDFIGRWLVIFTYPLDFTFVCPTEITRFSDMAEQFRETDCEVLGVSVDSVFSHIAWTEVPRNRGGLGQMNIELLSDLDHSFGTNYGCLLDCGHHCRATFIIDPKGIVRHMSMNDPPVGRNVQEILRLVQGYQHADVHGEVCPVEWNKKLNNDTIKPNPREKLDYFNKIN